MVSVEHEVHGAPAAKGLLEKLMAAVRPEFRIDVYFPDPEDPVLGRRTCPVPECDRSVAENGLCGAHGLRWTSQGRPAMEQFLANPGPEVKGRRQLGRCLVDGCEYGQSGSGLCQRHGPAWVRAGRPEIQRWAAEAHLLGRENPALCALPFCTVWTENPRQQYCCSHATRWKQLGSPTHEDYAAHCLQRGRKRLDFRELGTQLKLELQYAIQCSRDRATITTPPAVAIWTINKVKEARVDSLLELTAEQWRRSAGSKGGDYHGFLSFARDAIETLHEGNGWEVEYPRDVWRLHRLPGLTTSPGKRAHARTHLRLDRLKQPWLRALAKRWLRLRLSSGLSTSTAQGDLMGLIRFSTFLAERADISSLSGVDRAVLEDYLAWLSTSGIGPGARDDAITAPSTFFQAIRRYGWDETLPATATFFPGDIPTRPARVTRHIAEHIMAQIEAPHNINRWPTPEGRLITLILIRGGLRATDACTLAFDCLLHDGQGAPYLRYYNNKMRREAAVPIDEELEKEIRAQQELVSKRWPEPHPHLFVALVHNAGGRDSLSYHSYRGMLNTWLATCSIQDEHGQPVHLTPHQWRHTFACRLINKDVPQEVIRVLLDHQSTQMTAHYARITDQTVRRRWEDATKVNIKGERVGIEPDGPLAQAQWAKTRYGMATQSLPEGYCGLPVQKSCPHANACLTCPLFLTGPEFLPELREHRGRTLTLITKSEATGHTRVAEMNQAVLANLDKMIGELDDSEGTGNDH